VPKWTSNVEVTSLNIGGQKVRPMLPGSDGNRWYAADKPGLDWKPDPICDA
jgi:hypothetical protein